MRCPVLPLIFLVLFLMSPGAVHAQFGLPGAGTSLSLTTTPEYPGPQQTVRLTVQSALTDLSSSNITWYANGTVIASGVGVTEATVTTGLVGSATGFRVEVQGEISAAATGVLRPTAVDLVWEADSYVPPFYRGRALPSAGSIVRLFAVPHFQYSGTQSRVPANDLTYTWKKNGRTIASISGKGRHSVTMEGPVLFGSDTVSVEVSTDDSTLRGFASTRIASVEPSLILYENHPVFGILYHRALLANDAVPETEITLSAVPYFAPARNPDNGLLQYVWRVNNFAVQNDLARPSTITLNAEGSTGRAFIELALTHATNFFLSVRDSWTLTLAGSGSVIPSDPFRPSNQ